MAALPCRLLLSTSSSAAPRVLNTVSAARQGRLKIIPAVAALQAGAMTADAAALPPPPVDGLATLTMEPAAAALPPIGDRKLRILCLHGYLQNAEIFRGRIGSMRKALKGRAEFFFVDAPFTVEPEAADAQAVAESGGAAGAVGRSWWKWEDVEPGTRPSRAAQYSGWAEAQAAIAAALQEHAPIDGLLGFSQGATAAALFLAHANLPDGQWGAAQQQAGEQQQQQQQAGEQQQQAGEQQQQQAGEQQQQQAGEQQQQQAGEQQQQQQQAGEQQQQQQQQQQRQQQAGEQQQQPQQQQHEATGAGPGPAIGGNHAAAAAAAAGEAERHLRFAVIIAGFLPRDARYAAALRRGRPPLRSLHVWGAADELVPEERSRGLWETFAPGSVQAWQHPGAHMVPTCSGEFKAVLAALLDEVKLQGQASKEHHHGKHNKRRQHGHSHAEHSQQQERQQQAAPAAVVGVEGAGGQQAAAVGGCA